MAAASWGLVGIAFLLLRAIVRLSPAAWDGVSSGLGLWGWLAFLGWIGFMGYFEGYRGFQRGFAPRVVARALHLVRNPRPVHALLAPLFCMGLFHASRKRMITSWTLLVMIVAVVVAVGHMGQPVRGIIDAGVVFGLGWGLAAILGFSLAAVAGRAPRVAADLP